MNKAQAKIGMDMLNGTQSSCGSIVSHQHVENIKGSGVGNGSVILPSDFDVALNGERKKRKKNKRKKSINGEEGTGDGDSTDSLT